MRRRRRRLTCPELLTNNEEDDDDARSKDDGDMPRNERDLVWELKNHPESDICPEDGI